MNNVPLTSPMELRGDLASNWQFFKELWEDYITATESPGKDGRVFALNSYGARLPQGIKIN